MDLANLLSKVALFQGLSPAELLQVAYICKELVYQQDEIIMQQGDLGTTMGIVHNGLVEVQVQELGETTPRTVIDLGPGQVIGELALIDGGPRSATVRCVTPQVTLLIIDRNAFEELCQTHDHIGLVVYRNLAADVAFKLRLRHRLVPSELEVNTALTPGVASNLMCKISIVVPNDKEHGAIINTQALPAVGDHLPVGEDVLEVLEIRDLLPPRGDFHFMHATCKLLVPKVVA